MSSKKENEITVRVNCTNEELIKYLKKIGFYEETEFTLDDYYLIPKEMDLSNLSTREILSKAIIIRYIVDYDKITQKITFKIKNIDKDGRIVSQEAISCEVKSIEEAKRIFEAIGYYEIMNIKEKDIVYYNGDLKLAIKFIKNSNTLIEVETDENYNTVEKLIDKVKELKLPIDENEYFVKKAEEELNKRESRRYKMIDSKNGIIGLAIGDAMGVPLEFCMREKLMQNPTTTMLGYGSHDVPKGSWSDDTSMTLATIDSINNTHKIDTSDIAQRFINWIRNSEYTPTDKVFDIGRTTLQSLAKCELHVEQAESAGGDSEMDNGNGSLMRILPIAYYCFANNFENQKIYETVKSVSSITHRHEISIMGCYIYVCYAIELLKGNTKNQAYEIIQKLDYSMFCKDTINRYNRILTQNISKEKLENISSQGYIVSTLEATFWTLLNTKNFNQSIIGAVNLGDDTDTVGACVGGLAGIIYGIDNINKEWKKDLIKYEYIEKLCDSFNSILNK